MCIWGETISLSRVPVVHGLLGSLAWVALAVARAGALVGPAWKLVGGISPWVIAMYVGGCIVMGSA